MKYCCLPVLRRLIVAVAVLGALWVGGDGVQAQEPPPFGEIRDLSLSITHDRRVTDKSLPLQVHVRNDSAFRVRDVQVRITTDPPSALQGMHGLAETGRHREFVTNPDYDAVSGLWTVDELLPSQSNLLFLDAAGEDNANVPAPQYIKVRAAIIWSAPADSAQHRDNNQAEAWLYVSSSGDWIPFPDTTLTVNWDNRAAGVTETQVFAVTAAAADFTTRTDTRFGQEKVVVEVALSEGLAFAADPIAPAGTSFSRTSATTGVWRLGSGERVPGTLRVSTRLTTDAAQAPPLNRRCLTA